MPKSYARKFKKNGTRKNIYEKKGSHKLKHFQKEITVIFLEMLLMVKLYHWKTHSYATHKATDELYESLNSNIDKFIEVLLGKTGSRIDLMHHNNIHLIDLDSQEKLKSKVEKFKSYLVGLDNNKALHSDNMTNSDLFNIRDEIMGDMNKFLYLLTFK
jgi:DNA-binding ferritin-like protein